MRKLAVCHISANKFSSISNRDVRSGEAGEARDVFRGGHWAMPPPLGRQDSIISIE